MEHAIQLMMCISFFVLGLSALMHVNDWNTLVVFLQKRGRNTALALGIIHLLLGAFIVSFHWVWEGPDVVTTMIGILFVYRSIELLNFPDCNKALLTKLGSDYTGYVKFSAILLIVLAFILLANLYLI